jgi:hypothetical protein
MTCSLIRRSKDQYVRQLYARLGPEEFYRRRLAWLAANAKWTSYDRLVDWLRERGLVSADDTNVTREKRPEGDDNVNREKAARG